MMKPTWTVLIAGAERTEPFPTHEKAHEAADEIRRGGREVEVWRTDLLDEAADEEAPPDGPEEDDDYDPVRELETQEIRDEHLAALYEIDDNDD